MTPPLPRTLFVGKGQGSPCWYRCALPAMALGAEWVGVVGDPPDLRFVTGVTARSLSYDDLLDYEVLVVQQPVGPAWVRAIRELQAAGVTVLFEVDDYVHAVRKMDDHEFRASFGKEEMRRYELSMSVCDGLVVSTEYIARRYRSYNANVHVCRNGLDLKRYDLARPDRDHVAIGWAGGTGHREALRPWLPVVADVMHRHDRTRFVTVGQPWADALSGRFGDRTLALPFSSLETYPAAMTQLDVALAPAGRNAFFQGKSDLRWLEASALGIPVIADPSVYPEIEHGVTGFHATTPGEASELLFALVEDPALRERVGAAAQAYVREHRDIRVMADGWAEVLRAAVSAGEPAVA